MLTAWMRAAVRAGGSTAARVATRCAPSHATRAPAYVSRRAAAYTPMGGRAYTTTTRATETGKRFRPLRAGLLTLVGGGVMSATAVAVVSPDLGREMVLTADGVLRTLRTVAAAAIVTADYKLLALRDLDKQTRRRERAEVHRRSAQRFLRVFFANGGVYIKAGQHIAAMTHILPREWTETMRPCQDQAPIDPFEDVKLFVEAELGGPLEQFFSEFDQTAIASASLAQVHRARLHTGEEVAVKVQHRGIADRCAGDTYTIALLARVCQRFFPEYQFQWLVEEFRDNLPKELDFIGEGHNGERLDWEFRHDPQVKVPRIEWDYTTKHVLVMEYVHGVKISDVPLLEQMGLSAESVSRELYRIFSEQMFVLGVVHADPHPGNILVRKVNGKPQLVLLDHGLIRVMTEQFKADYCNLWHAMIMRDEEGIYTHAHRLGVGNYHRLLFSMLTVRAWGKTDVGMNSELSEEEREILQDYSKMYMADIFEVLGTVPREMLLLFKCNDLLRSVHRDLGARNNSYSIMARYCIIGRTNHLRATQPGWRTDVRAIWERLLVETRVAYFSFLLTLYNTIINYSVYLGVFLGYL